MGSQRVHTTEQLNWNYGGGNEDNGDLPQNIPCMHCYSLCPQPCSRPPLTYAFAGGSPTPAGKSPVGSLLLSPGSWCTRFCCALQECISQSCVSSGSSMVGLMVTSSQRTYAIPTPRAPVPAADHCRPGPPKAVSVSVGSPGPGAHRFVWALWASLAGTGFDSKREFAPPTVLLGLLLCPWTWGIPSQPLQRLPSYWGLSDVGCGSSPHGQSSEAQLMLLPWTWGVSRAQALVNRWVPGSVSMTIRYTMRLSDSTWYCQVDFRSCSITQSCPTLCNPMDWSTPGLPVHHQLLELAQTHVHWVGDVIEPSHPVSSPSPPVFNLPQHQGLFWVSSWDQVAKVWSFSISPSKEYSVFISFRIDWLDLLAVQGTLKSFLQHYSLKASVLWCSAFFMVQLLSALLIFMYCLIAVSLRM